MAGNRFAQIAVAAMFAAMLALALCGCGFLADDDSSTPAEGTAAAAYGLPRLPTAQGVIDLSPTRAVEVLGNFAYREHDGEGQWANATAAFDALDNDAQATLEAPLASGTPGWVMQLSSYDGREWHDCTLEDLQSGEDPGRATVTVFPLRGISFGSTQEAADFLDAMYPFARGHIVVDADGRIPCAVVKNTSGAVCQIFQDDPGTFRLYIHPKSDWEDGTYDGLVDECRKYAEEHGCAITEFAKVAPLFEEPRVEPVK